MAERDRCAETTETSTDDSYIHALEICCHDLLRKGKQYMCGAAKSMESFRYKE
jgi:hypothetical protein